MLALLHCYVHSLSAPAYVPGYSACAVLCVSDSKCQMPHTNICLAVAAACAPQAGVCLSVTQAHAPQDFECVSQ